MRGAHGTCRSFARSIGKDGFKLKEDEGRQGKLGTGVYFWEYCDAKAIATELSRGWYVQAEKSEKSPYEGIRGEPRCCAVVYVGFKEPHKILRLDTDESRTILQEFYDEIIEKLEHVDRAEQCNICDNLVMRLEKKGGFKYDLVGGQVHLPAKGLPKNHISRVYDTWPCLVVKNVSIIKVDEVIEYE